jgi:hypothetical protein
MFFQKIRQWYNGKDVRIDPDEPETIGGLGVIHETYKEFHWTAKSARYLVSFFLRYWQWICGSVLAIFLASQRNKM